MPEQSVVLAARSVRESTVARILKLSYDSHSHSLVCVPQASRTGIPQLPISITHTKLAASIGPRWPVYYIELGISAIINNTEIYYSTGVWSESAP